MKIISSILFWLGLLYFNSLIAQVNLVNNPGFENYTTCPNAVSQLSLCSDWTSNCGTPDYFNNCGTQGFCIPNNVFGYQQAASGNAYAGIIFLQLSPNGPIAYRELMGAKLTQTLVVGKRYYLSMQISIAEYWNDTSIIFNSENKTATEMSLGSYPCYVPANKMGVKFFTKSHIITYTYFPTTIINNTAHIYSSNIVSDTTNWTTVRGSFIADSAYTHIMIGDFFYHPDTIRRPQSFFSYYYIDDVIVSPDSAILYTAINKLASNKQGFAIYPNPASDVLVIEAKTSNDKTLLTIFIDQYGHDVKHTKLEQKSNLVSLKDLNSGLYLIKIVNTEGELIYQNKFLKE